jgi:hypothetical protein
MAETKLEWRHVYPRSLGNPNLGTEGPGSDAHHLRASDITLNAETTTLWLVLGIQISKRYLLVSG